MILIIAEAGNQIDYIDLKDETKMPRYSTKAVAKITSRLHWGLNITLNGLKRTTHSMHSLCLVMDYAYTYYWTFQPKTTTKYLWTYVVNFGGTIHTSLPIITSR
jgi:hypothetical protein